MPTGIDYSDMYTWLGETTFVGSSVTASDEPWPETTTAERVVTPGDPICETVTWSVPEHISEGHVGAPRIAEEHNEFRLRRLGLIKSETELPWPPETDLRYGDTFLCDETGRDWVWMGNHWEEMHIETVQTMNPVPSGDEEVGIDMTDISGEPAPVLVSGDYLYIPGDMERRIRVRLEDIVAGDPPVIGNWVDVAEAVFNGERVNLAERIIESSREHAERESDTTTETTPEAFDDILGVGA